ncbi:MAG TPA: PEP-CTERM sorting domain-containing protein [Luteolibacter sp.]|nr:PEP-CTERM sorting domain-containing protein [Luteolibacter sp.]
MYSYLASFLLLATAPAFATVLSNLPTPMEQGGMIHINVAYNETTDSLSVNIEPGTPALQPLSSWKPGDSFDPASPWYATLDSSQAAGMFNSQFGLVLFESDPLPADTSLFVNLVSGSPGLEVFRWRNNVPQLFEGIMGTDGSDASWDWGTVAHGMFHPMFVMPAGSSGTANATLGFTLVDSGGVPVPGVNTAQAGLTFEVVPEPSSALLALVGACLLFRRRKTVSRS